jgi:hypothetical protein
MMRRAASPESNDRSGCMMFVESDARMLRSHRSCPHVRSMRGDASDMSAYSTTASRMTSERQDKERDKKCTWRLRIDQMCIYCFYYKNSPNQFPSRMPPTHAVTAHHARQNYRTLLAMLEQRYRESVEEVFVLRQPLLNHPPPPGLSCGSPRRIAAPLSSKTTITRRWTSQQCNSTTRHPSRNW